MSFTRNTEILVIGAGPAGLAAAAAARAAGAAVLILDEYGTPGGQFYKQPASSFRVPDRGKLDPDYTKGDMLIADVRERGVEILQDTLVWGSFGTSEVSVARHGENGTVRASRIVVAAGAYERVIPFPGWDLPGVMTPGGAQTLVKSQQVIPGKRIVLAGSGPFLMPVAKTLLTAGANVVAILEATRPRHWASQAFELWGHGERLREALDYRRVIRRAGVPTYFGEIVVEARGNDALELVFAKACDRAGRVAARAHSREIAADVLCVGYGFVPAVQLTRLLGCEHRYDAGGCGWVPAHDEIMQTSVAGVFVAGEVAGIGGAYTALAEGQVAGLAAARQLGYAIDTAKLEAAQRERAHRRRFARLVNALFAVKPAYYEQIGDDTLVCRCEEVSAAEVRAALADWGSDVNCIKGMTRCGMGYCQGRVCGPTIEAMTARVLGMMPHEVGAMNIRPPIKPITVATLAGLGQE